MVSWFEFKDLKVLSTIEPSPREREKDERNDRRGKQKQHPLASTASTVDSYPTFIQVSAIFKSVPCIVSIT